MLRKITVKNFKCFKYETVLDLRKTNYKFLEQNTCGKILKGALLVGDHASGKTAILQSVRLLPDLLFRQESCDLKRCQCVFSKEEVCRLAYEFEIDSHDLAYSFSFSGGSFVEENLQIDGRTVIGRLGKKCKWTAGKETVLSDIDDSELFLRNISMNPEYSGGEILEKFFDFLKRSVYIDTYARRIAAFDGECLSAEKYAETHGTDRINEFLTEYQFPYLLRYRRESDGGGQIFFEREGSGMLIPSWMESSGNRILLNLLPAVLRAAGRKGILMIDQFGGLHNRLEELLIRFMMEQESGAQLFLTSHSTNLLSNSLLRPDQIFAVERRGSEGSGLHRFSDEQPRVAQNLEKMYLSGVFGGLPAYKMKDSLDVKNK